jgi:hypothetical protein
MYDLDHKEYILNFNGDTAWRMVAWIAERIILILILGN